MSTYSFSWLDLLQGGDDKKGGHTATPHPAKYAGKTPASSDKSKQQTPKSAGSVSCKSCSKYDICFHLISPFFGATPFISFFTLQ